MVKFSWLGSQKFEETLEMIHGDMSVEYVLRNLRRNIRKGLRATVYTIPSKEKGLRLQSSEVHIGVRAGVLRKFL